MNTPHSAKYVWQQPAWPAWRFDLPALATPLAQARLDQGRVIGKAQAIGMTGDAMAQVISDIWIGEVIATAAIEGQKLDAEQVRSSVMRMLGMGGSAHAARHVDGLVEVLHDATSNFSVPLDSDRLCRWQSALFPGGTSGIRRIDVGKFRTHEEAMQIVSGRPGREIVHFRAPDSANIATEMERLIAWFNQSNAMDGILRAAVAHLWFETIHPFEDGNGRVGRAIMDMAIAQDSQSSMRLYSMSRQMEENRAAYYDALNYAQRGDLDITNWLLWFVGQFSSACKKSELLIDRALEKARYWATHAAQPFNERQRKTLQKLLDAGDGGFLGGLTTEKYCKITGVSKATATRDLSDLLAREALFVRGVGKATKYYVNVPGWRHEEGLAAPERR